MQRSSEAGRTLCGAPIERVAGIDLGEILRAGEGEGEEVSGVSILLRCLRKAFGDEQFTAEEVAELHNAGSLEQDVPCAMRATLEDATGKPFPPQPSMLEARKVGKRLQMIVGRPVQVDEGVLVLQRTANPKIGNRYRVASTG